MTCTYEMVTERSEYSRCYSGFTFVKFGNCQCPLRNERRSLDNQQRNKQQGILNCIRTIWIEFLQQYNISTVLSSLYHTVSTLSICLVLYSTEDGERRCTVPMRILLSLPKGSLFYDTLTTLLYNLQFEHYLFGVGLRGVKNCRSQSYR